MLTEDNRVSGGMHRFTIHFLFSNRIELLKLGVLPGAPVGEASECDDIGTVTRRTVPYNAQIDSGSERGIRWYMWYSSVIGQFPKHVRDIRVFISMRTVQYVMA
jgi:hypothetical protein